MPVWSRKAETDACFERMTRAFIEATPRAAGDAGNRAGQGFRVYVVQQHGVHAFTQNLVELIQSVDFDRVASCLGSDLPVSGVLCDIPPPAFEQVATAAGVPGWGSRHLRIHCRWCDWLPRCGTVIDGCGTVIDGRGTVIDGRGTVVDGLGRRYHLMLGRCSRLLVAPT